MWKSRPRSRNFPTLLTSRAGTFNTWVMSLCSSWKEEDLFKHSENSLRKLKDASEMTGKRTLEILRDIQDNFPIRLLSPFNWTFTDGRESKFKSCSFWIRSQLQTGLTLGIAFWAFAQLLLLSINHCKERNWTRNQPQFICWISAVSSVLFWRTSEVFLVEA